MSDLERLVRQIFRNLSATDPTRLLRPLPLIEIRESIVPYRANRRALQLDSSEEYELVIMRLCAGEGGYARTAPEVRAEFVKEVRSANPDLTIVERHRDAVVSLEPTLVARAADPKPELAYAPQEQQVSRSRRVEKPVAAAPLTPARRPAKTAAKASDTASDTSRCAHCGAGLPAGRAVNFCPKCGQSQLRCPKCRTELEPGWKHCVGCGAALGAR